MTVNDDNWFPSRYGLTVPYVSSSFTRKIRVYAGEERFKPISDSKNSLTVELFYLENFFNNH